MYEIIYLNCFLVHKCTSPGYDCVLYNTILLKINVKLTWYYPLRILLGEEFSVDHDWSIKCTCALQWKDFPLVIRSLYRLGCTV